MRRLLTTLAILGACSMVGRTADAQPELVPIQGMLTNVSSAPVGAAALPMTFSLYYSETGGSPFFTEVAVLEVDAGRFDYYLGLTEALDLDLFEGSDVWLGVSVNFEAELTPRIPLGTVAYAAYAGAVDWSQIENVPADLVDGDNDTTYTGAQPIAITGTTISLASAACAPGETWVWNGASWACTSPSPFAIGDGLQIVAGDLRVDSTIQRRLSANCPAGQFLRGFSQAGAPICANDDGGASYTANNGVALSGTNFSADTGFLQRRVTGGPCAWGIAQVNGDGTVVCASNNDTNTTYTPGNGITISGATNTISANLSVVQARIATTSCTHGIQSISSTGAIVCASAPAIPSYSGTLGVSLSGTTFSADTSYVQRRVTGTCAHGINSITATGGVTCASPSSIAGGTCGVRQYMYGITAGGAPLCRSIENDVRHFASSYIRNECVLWVGWSDNNVGCCQRVNHGGLHGSLSRPTVVQGHHRWYNWPGWENMQLTGFRTAGDVDDNDWFYIGLHCPQR